MKGKITSFKAEKGFGFIKGEDKKNYFFHISNVSNPMDIEENYTVDFKAQEKDKGLFAIDITINTPLANKSKDKILKIKDLRIRASDIKEYEISKKNTDDVDEDDNFHYKLHEDIDYYICTGDIYLEYCKDYYKNYATLDYVRKGFSESLEYYMISPNSIDFESVQYSSFKDKNTRGILAQIYKNDDCKCLRPIDDFANHNFFFDYIFRDCYMLTIKTYTSGKKVLKFISHDDKQNKEDAYKWLDYIDNELEKLI